MSNVLEFSLEGSSSLHQFLTVAGLAQAVRMMLADMRVPDDVQVDNSGGLEILSFFGNANSGSAHVTFSINQIIGSGAHGERAGVRLNSNGTVSLLGDFFGQVIDHNAPVGTFVHGSVGEQIQLRLQRRILQVEIATALGIELAQVEQVLGQMQYNPATFGMAEINRIRVALTLVREFGIDFANAMRVAMQGQYKDEAAVLRIRERLTTASVFFADLSLTELELLAKALGFSTDKQPVVLIKELAGVLPQASLTGIMRLKLGKAEFVVRQVDASYTHPESGAVIPISGFELIGSRTAHETAKDAISQLQSANVQVAAMKTVVSQFDHSSKVAFEAQASGSTVTIHVKEVTPEMPSFNTSSVYELARFNSAQVIASSLQTAKVR